MRRLKTLLQILLSLLALLLLALLVSPAAAQDDVIRSRNNPLIIQGYRPELANNIVLTIDDNVYEGNIRWLLDVLRERGLRASFFPHTHYMLRQDPAVWRQVVADGHEIGYFTRRHEHGMTRDEFIEDFNLYQQELREILGDPNYTIRYAKPACWYWENEWFDWLDYQHQQSGMMGVRTNILGPAPSISYMENVFNNSENGGRIISIISFTDQIEWFEANLDALQQLRAPSGQPYIITSLTQALGD